MQDLAAGRIASPLVVAKLVELGYLKRAKRHNARAVENAVFRLLQRLHHQNEDEPLTTRSMNS